MGTAAETDSLQSCFCADGRTRDHNALRQRVASYLSNTVQISLISDSQENQTSTELHGHFKLKSMLRKVLLWSSFVHIRAKWTKGQTQRLTWSLKKKKKMLRMFLPHYGRQISWNGKSSHSISEWSKSSKTPFFFKFIQMTFALNWGLRGDVAGEMKSLEV